MYCPVCGTESTEGLNYCKRCGASLGTTGNATEGKSISLSLVGMFLFVIGVVTVLGIIVPIVATSELAGKGLQPGLLEIIVLLSSVTAIGTDALLVWLLLHLIKISQPGRTIAKAKKIASTKQVPAQITAPPVVLPSVTEHTTRSFEPGMEKEIDLQPREPGQRATR